MIENLKYYYRQNLDDAGKVRHNKILGFCPSYIELYSDSELGIEDIYDKYYSSGYKAKDRLEKNNAMFCDGEVSVVPYCKKLHEVKLNAMREHECKRSQMIVNDYIENYKNDYNYETSMMTIKKLNDLLTELTLEQQSVVSSAMAKMVALCARQARAGSSKEG